MKVRNRLGYAGESLITHRFPHAIGFIGKKQKLSLSERIADWFRVQLNWPIPERFNTECAVCLPPGARLALSNLSPSFQHTHGVSAQEFVTFDQHAPVPNQFRDGIRFSKRKFVLLQTLGPGVRAEVLSIDLNETEAEYLGALRAMLQEMEERPFATVRARGQ